MKRCLRVFAIACLAIVVFLFPPALLCPHLMTTQQAFAETVLPDDLVSFEFSSPAIRVLLDGEPLAIIPETLAVDVSYYNSEGELVERTISYDYDNDVYNHFNGIETEWTDIVFLVGGVYQDLIPKYDSETDAWYYEVLENRMDVPMRDISVSASDVHANMVEGGNEDAVYGPDLSAGSLVVYKFVTDTPMMWTWESCGNKYDTVLGRGTKAGVCAFSKGVEDEEAFMGCTDANEPYYLCLYNSGETYASGYSFEVKRSSLYKGASDEMEGYFDNIASIEPNDHFCFAVDVAEAGWYQMVFSDFDGFSTKPEVYVDVNQPQDHGLWDEEVDYEHKLNKTKPLWLEPGTTFFYGHAWVNALFGPYSSASMTYSLNRLGDDDFLFSEPLLFAHSDIEAGYEGDWVVEHNANETLATSISYSPFFEDDEPKFSPSCLVGRGEADFFAMSVNCVLTSYPYASFGYFSTSLRDMTLLSDTELVYELIGDNRIVLQLLDPDGSPLDLTSTETLVEGNYTFRLTTYCGETQLAQHDCALNLPEVFAYEILSPDDLRISFGDMDEGSFVVAHPSEDVWQLTKFNSLYVDMYYEILSRMTVTATMTDQRSGNTIEVDFSCFDSDGSQTMPYDDGCRYPGVGINGEHDYVRYVMSALKGDSETEVPLEISDCGTYRLDIRTSKRDLVKSIYISVYRGSTEHSNEAITSFVLEGEEGDNFSWMGVGNPLSFPWVWLSDCNPSDCIYDASAECVWQYRSPEGDVTEYHESDGSYTPLVAGTWYLCIVVTNESDLPFDVESLPGMQSVFGKQFEKSPETEPWKAVYTSRPFVVTDSEVIPGDDPIPQKSMDNVTVTIKDVVYNGKVQSPSPVVKDGSVTLAKGADYAVSYAPGRKNVGAYKVTVTGKGNYAGSKTVAFKINPKGTSVSKLSGASRAISVKWKKQAAKMSTSVVSGYQIQLATNAKFTKGVKNVTVSGYKNTSKKVSGLKAKTKYYVRIRTYKKVGRVKYYSKWSGKKSVKTR